MPHAPGTRLGPYEILATLGAGGMGEVYRARDTRLDREVAIKVLPERMAADQEALARFAREAKAVAALSHPNILAIHDYGVEGSTAYSVTEMLVGDTLRERIGGAPIPQRKAMDYALQIAQGLAAAHDRGIVHRDLKPENLFITQDGRVKILDFGLAKLGAPASTDATALPTLDGATKPGTIMGTMAYMSPEQMRGQAVDHRADIFAFGTILYEMLTGRPAFRRDTAADTTSAILREEPPELSQTGAGTSPELERIVSHCLEKNPAMRFQSARDLAFNLETLTGGSLTTAPQAPSTAAHSAKSFPWRMLVVLAAGALAGLAAGVALAPRFAPAGDAEPPTLRYLSHSGRDSQPSASRDGRLVAYQSLREGVSQIWLMQLAGGDEVALTSGPGDSRPRISPDGSQVLFVREESGVSSLYRIAVLGGEPRKVLHEAYDGDWSPDGRRIAFLRRARTADIPSTTIGLADAGGEEVTEIHHLEQTSLDNARWSPDGASIAISSYASENAPSSILLVPAGGGEPRTIDLPPPAGLISSVAWTGGHTLVYAQSDSFVNLGASGGTGRLFAHDVVSGRRRTLLWIPMSPFVDIVGDGAVVMGAVSQRQNLLEATPLAEPRAHARWLTHGNSIDRQPVFSPDGKWILFSSNRSGNLDLWKLSTETGAVRRITEDATDDWDPAFTPDGSQILWSSARAGHFEIWICRSDGTGARQLTSDGVDAENPTATADGRWIVYNSTNPAAPGIWKIKPDGTGAVRIVPGLWSTPQVSPDGVHVAFRTLSEQRSVMVARVEDGAMAGLPIALHGNNLAGRPRWMPDGRALLFTGTDDAGTMGVYVQDFVAGKDTTATRRPVVPFDADMPVESFDVSPDGRRVVIGIFEETSSLMLAEGLPGVEPAGPSR